MESQSPSAASSQVESEDEGREELDQDRATEMGYDEDDTQAQE